MNGSIKFRHGRDLTQLENEFGKIFDAFIPRDQGTGKDHRTWSPRTDVSESENTFELNLDLPGMTKDDIDISFHDGVLEISGDRSLERNESEDSVFRFERKSGKFSRTFTLGKAIDTLSISASYEAGVLTVTVPKAEESKARKIKVD